MNEEMLKQLSLRIDLKNFTAPTFKSPRFSIRSPLFRFHPHLIFLSVSIFFFLSIYLRKFFFNQLPIDKSNLA